MTDVTSSNKQLANPNAPVEARSSSVRQSPDGHWEVVTADGIATQWSTEEAARLHADNLADPESAGNAAGDTTDELRLAHRMRLQQDAQKLVDDGVA